MENGAGAEKPSWKSSDVNMPAHGQNQNYETKTNHELGRTTARQAAESNP
jgi:hypothetical protein